MSSSGRAHLREPRCGRIATIIFLAALAPGAHAAGPTDDQLFFSPGWCPSGETCDFKAEGVSARTKPPGGLDLTWTQSDGRTQSWEIRAKDFASAIKCSEEMCSLPSAKGCYAGCVATPPIPKILDRRTGRLYFTVLGFDGEVTLFAFDLANAKTSPVLEDRSFGGIGEVSLSPGRRYLAYLRGHHGSYCEDFLRLRVYDLNERRHLSFPGDADPWKRVHEAGIVDSYSDPRWLSENEIELRHSEWTIEACVGDKHPDEDRVTIVRLEIPPVPAGTAATPSRR